MGRITYHPRPKNKSLHNNTIKEKDTEINYESNKHEDDGAINIEALSAMKPENIRAIGDVSCDYHIYLEDYVYTYLYQYACLDLKKEQSAIFVGKISKETKEVAIWGVIPIDEDMLERKDEWLSKEAIEYAEKERDEYFEGSQIVGWMHMQPGYGTMITVKELKIHREFFTKEIGIILLLDPINRIETFCICEGEELREQTGYYMYYERNEQMQRYMLEHPLIKQEMKKVEDNVVAQFREIGKKRKNQYIQRRKTNMVILGASVILIVLSAIITRQGASDNNLNTAMNNEVLTQNEAVLAKEVFANGEEALSDEDVGVKVIINKEELNDQQNSELNNQQNNNEMAEDMGSSSDSIQVAQIGDEDALQVSNQVESNEEVQNVSIKEKVNVSEEKEDKQEVVKTIHSEQEIIEEVAEDKETEAVKYKEYIIQPGDTLRKISFQHYQTETKARDIAKFNNMTNTDHIQIGQKIKIPLE